MRSALVDDALDLLRQHGLIGMVTNGGSHIKIKFNNRYGRPCLLIVARSPSSQRAVQKNRSELRRLLRRQPAARDFIKGFDGESILKTKERAWHPHQ
jgi:hypothetical protein